jgi:anti-anti-sigma factor
MESTMTNVQELREIVNPVFNTAKSCVQLNAASGDEDAQRLLEEMGFESFAEHTSDAKVPPEMVEQVKRLAPAYMVVTESRFQAANKIIESRADCQIVDLPCGYSSRGVLMNRQGRKYLGLDLPAVIDVIGPATHNVIAEQGGANPEADVRYHAVDATNYDSLREATEGVSDKLLITTEGLLMYFTQPELEEVFSNIHRLLEDHGGSWVIADRAMTQCGDDIAAAALGNEPQLVGLYKAITARAAGTVSDFELYNNVFFDDDEEKLKTFVRDMGFELQLVPVYDHMPDQFGSLRTAPEVEDGVREVFKELFYWELTVARAGEVREHHGTSFSADAAIVGSLLRFTLNGRLDTLTAPDLLELYQGIDPQSYERIEVDMRGLEYVSSAGVRVLTIMAKGLKDMSGFHITNAQSTVYEVFDAMGLTEIFGM